METGDVVLTPGWCWHGHGHDGDEPAYWFDGLDVPLTHLLEPMFFQEHPQKHQKVERVVQTSPYRFKREDIAHWAIHPGGRAIVDRLAELFALTPEQVAASLAVLRRYGNMSSPSVH